MIAPSIQKILAAQKGISIAKAKANFDNANKLDYYFNSYSSHHIHEEMLKDKVRTLAY